MSANDPLAPCDAVVMLSYGGPDGPDAVLPFMRNATSGRGIPDERLLEVAGHYQHFDGVSPINARNAELREALAAELARRGSELPVVIGNRNWHPFFTSVFGELIAQGKTRLLVLPTAAFASYSGCRQYAEDVQRALDVLRGEDIPPRQGEDLSWVPAWRAEHGHLLADVEIIRARPYYATTGMVQANHDTILDAYRELAAQGFPSEQVHLVMVTHSIPTSMETGSAPSDAERAEYAADLGIGVDDPAYIAQHQHLQRVLEERLGATLGHEVTSELVYCSRSGPPQAKWLEPDVNDYLEAYAEGDHLPAVIVAPFGFICDHMEVVFDLDTEAFDTAQRCGLAYVRAGTAGVHPAFVASVADVLCEQAAQVRDPSIADGTLAPFAVPHPVRHRRCHVTQCRPGGRPRKDAP